MFFLIRKLLSDRMMMKCYVKAGAYFGDAVSYLGLGECVGFEKLLSRWQKWEVEYARRGYRTISLDEFVAYGGGYSNNLKHIFEKREPGELAVFYAKIYRDSFLGQIKPVVDLQELLRSKRPQSGECKIPSIPRLK